MTHSVLLSSFDLIAASQKMSPAIDQLSNRTPTVPVSKGSGRTETPSAFAIRSLAFFAASSVSYLIVIHREPLSS
jgi:hypothetical protein